MSRARRARPEPLGLSLKDAVRQAFAPELAVPRRREAWRKLSMRWKHNLARLRPLGGMSRGNKVELFQDGDLLLEALWAAIAGAERHVLLATYIFEPDRVGLRTLSELAGAAARGVAVNLRYDSVGSSNLGAEHLEELRRLGAKVEEYNPFFTWRSRLSKRLVRDHRKVCVVDGRVAFCGGMNVTEDYAGPRYGNGRFLDAHLRVGGPAVQDLEALFQERGRRKASEAVGEGTFVQVLESNRWRKRRAIQRALRYTISRAGERVWLTTPYFLPTPRLQKAIVRAARRGVDVRLLTAGQSDVPVARVLGRHIYGRYLRCGVRIFEMRERTLHAKIAVIDGIYGSVGSFNLDILSDRYNHEVNVTVLERAFSRELEQAFERDMQGAVEVTAATWGRRGLASRLAGWFLFQLVRIF